MITSTFELLTDIRNGLASQLDAAEAKHRFYLASAGLNAAIYGGAGGGGESAGAGVALADAGGAGH